jgi:YVTN family beta-propeller protein
MSEMLKRYTALLILLILEGSLLTNMEAKGLQLQKNITGTGLTPKSVVHAGKGLFFAQNMMYNHNISVFNRKFERIKIISDAVDLSKFGFMGHEGKQQGAPVECAFSDNGQYAWVSNYQMYGKGFNNAGEDNCRTSNGYDHSFLYKINTQSLAIEHIVQVGAVPKYVAVTPDSRYVLVSNWCSGDVTVVDNKLGKSVKSVFMGAHPRGMVVDSESEKVYVAVMGSTKIGVIDLKDFSVSWLNNVGGAPRHLCISPDNKYLYTTLNSEGKVAKIDLKTGKVVTKVKTGNAPRSMAMMGNGAYLYVVNYLSNTLSKIRASDMKVIESIPTKDKPIGVTTDEAAQTVWVACYSGNIMVFKDTELNTAVPAQKPQEAPISVPNSPKTIAATLEPTNLSTNSVRIAPTNIAKNLPVVKPVATILPTKIIAKPQRTLPPAVVKTATTNGYYIVVGSSTNRAKAEQNLALWKAKGLSKSRIVVANNNFRVATNYYKTKAEANKMIGQIKSKYNSSAWILEQS